jgi:hypothetical protein
MGLVLVGVFFALVLGWCVLIALDSQRPSRGGWMKSEPSKAANNLSLFGEKYLWPSLRDRGVDREAFESWFEFEVMPWAGRGELSEAVMSEIRASGRRLVESRPANN